MEKYNVTVHPDGSIDVTWPSPTEQDPEAREAAILDRDTLGCTMLSTTLGLLKAGVR